MYVRPHFVLRGSNVTRPDKESSARVALAGVSPDLARTQKLLRHIKVVIVWSSADSVRHHGNLHLLAPEGPEKEAEYPQAAIVWQYAHERYELGMMRAAHILEDPSLGVQSAPVNVLVKPVPDAPVIEDNIRTIIQKTML